MIKRFVYLVLSLAVMAAVAGCSDGKKAQLKEAVLTIDKRCPVSMGSIGDLISIKYDDESNVVQYYYSVNEDVAFNIDFIEENKEVAASSIKLMFSKSEMKEVLDFIIDVGASLKVVYKGSSTGKSTEVEVTSEELADLKDKPYSDREINEMLLKNEISAIQASLPWKVEDGMEMDKVYDDGENVVYSCRMDEDLYDISLLETGLANVKDEVLEGFSSDVAVKKMIGILVNLDKGFVYRYYGDQSGKSVDVEFTPADLRAFLRKNPVKFDF